MRIPWPILIVALVLPTAAALVYFVAADPESPVFRIAYAASKTIQFALPIASLVLFDRVRLRSILFSNNGLWTGIVVGLLMFTAIVGAYVSIYRNSSILAEVVEIARGKVAGFGVGSERGFLLLAVFLCLVHSFLEEYYWRWFVHAGLRERLSRPAAIAVSSLGFAAHHVVVLQVYFPTQTWMATVPFSLGVAAAGACWAWLYERGGSLAGAWAAHALADAALLAIGFDLLYR